jgi:hypothetical protein
MEGIWDLTCYTLSLYRGLNLGWINGSLDYYTPRTHTHTHTHTYTTCKVKLVKGSTLQDPCNSFSLSQRRNGEEKKIEMRAEHTEICNVPLMSWGRLQLQERSNVSVTTDRAIFERKCCSDLSVQTACKCFLF